MQTLLWRPRPKQRVQCLLCRHFCRLEPGTRGLCGVRENQGGALVTLAAEGVIAWQVDPVEKKPLYHYLPGTKTFSFATAGCNFSCRWCQNAHISAPPRGAVPCTPARPQDLVQAALDSGCRSLAFTYTEPTVFFELMLATAVMARQNGLGTLMVSNGYQSPACLNILAPHIQAANIDLKCFRQSTYKKFCNASLAPVLDNLRRMAALGLWLEITTLVIPGINDSPAELADIAAFIANELGPHTPWHVSAFHPAHLLNPHPATPPSSLTLAADLGQKAGLHFVYKGNIGPANATSCPHCGRVAVARNTFKAPSLPGGLCPHCGAALPGIWENI